MESMEERIMDLRIQGNSCSQILIQVAGLDLLGEEDPMLVKAMGALGYGVQTQHACGALTGAACALALHMDDKREMKQAVKELVAWFEQEFESANCGDILGLGNPPSLQCQDIVARTAEHCVEMLAEAGYLE